MSHSNSQNIAANDDDMLPEYDFTKGIRGKHYQEYRQGYTTRVYQEDGSVEVRQFAGDDDTVTLDPDVRQYFPDSEAVNTALRGLIQLIPQTQTE